MTSPALIVVAGGGIAGLTTALALASRGFSVRVYERTAVFGEVGAGVQLSPNATRILGRLGVLDHLRRHAVQPPAIILHNARSLREMAHIPLGEAATARWGAPYLVAHRADLQAALLAALAARPMVEVLSGNAVVSWAADPQSRGVTVQTASGAFVHAALLVAADGVWSRLRPPGADAVFTGTVAWRASFDAAGEPAAALTRDLSVGAFLAPGFHLIAYPISGGRKINVVAFTPGHRIAEDWSVEGDAEALQSALRACSPLLARLANGAWTAFPLFTVPPRVRWTAGRNFALIGDAAHAMTPFAAQGAAMAIEDADTLAARLAAGGGDLSGWESMRRARIDAVRRRGAFNGFVWHARGPVALARDAVLRLRSPAALAADMDWLYGWDASAQSAQPKA